MLLLLIVEALKVTRISIAHSTRSHCYRQGGGALNTRMNLFDRFARVVKVRFFELFIVIYRLYLGAEFEQIEATYYYF